MQRSRYKLQNAISNGEECHVELVNYRKDGSVFWNDLYIAPIHDSEGIVTHYIGIQNDISERKLQGIALKFAKEQQLQSLKKEFVTTASNELRTPLTNLKATVQLLSRLINEDLSETKQRLLLNKANTNMNKLSSLVEDLLHVSRLESGRLLHQYSEFKLAAIVQDVIENFGFEEKYSISLTGDIQLKITADKDRIEQVILNLLNNAIKYSPQEKNIDVIIAKDQDKAKLTVKDQGVGIPPDQLPYIFNRYYRGDQVGLQESGLGLGLYISDEIIRSHNGEMCVESNQGKGSTFSFIIPLANNLLDH